MTDQLLSLGMAMKQLMLLSLNPTSLDAFKQTLIAGGTSETLAEQLPSDLRFAYGTVGFSNIRNVICGLPEERLTEYFESVILKSANNALEAMENSEKDDLNPDEFIFTYTMNDISKIMGQGEKWQKEMETITTSLFTHAQRVIEEWAESLKDDECDGECGSCPECN